MMAMHNNPAHLRSQLSNSRRYLPHRNVRGAGDSCCRDLAVLTAIKQHELLTEIQHLFNGPDINVERQHRLEPESRLEKVKGPRSNVQSYRSSSGTRHLTVL